MSFLYIGFYYAGMPYLSNRDHAIIALLSAALACSSAGAQPERLPPGALILFGANWCAPCLDELRSLPAYAAAVDPAPVLIAWTDGQPRNLWRQWPENARILPPGSAAALLARTGGKTAGLPYVVLLGRQGQLCADLRGKLNSERLAAMRKQCNGAGEPHPVTASGS